MRHIRKYAVEIHACEIEDIWESDKMRVDYGCDDSECEYFDTHEEALSYLDDIESYSYYMPEWHEVGCGIRSLGSFYEAVIGWFEVELDEDGELPDWWQESYDALNDEEYRYLGEGVGEYIAAGISVEDRIDSLSEEVLTLLEAAYGVKGYVEPSYAPGSYETFYVILQIGDEIASGDNFDDGLCKIRFSNHSSTCNSHRENDGEIWLNEHDSVRSLVGEADEIISDRVTDYESIERNTIDMKASNNRNRQKHTAASWDEAGRLAHKRRTDPVKNAFYAGFRSARRKAIADVDGWDDGVIEESTLRYVLDNIHQLDYELESCVRGAKTHCETYSDLAYYIKDLARDLDAAADELATMAENGEI